MSNTKHLHAARKVFLALLFLGAGGAQGAQGGVLAASYLATYPNGNVARCSPVRVASDEDKTYFYNILLDNDEVSLQRNQTNYVGLFVLAETQSEPVQRWYVDRDANWIPLAEGATPAPAQARKPIGGFVPLVVTYDWPITSRVQLLKPSNYIPVNQIWTVLQEANLRISAGYGFVAVEPPIDENALPDPYTDPATIAALYQDMQNNQRLKTIMTPGSATESPYPLFTGYCAEVKAVFGYIPNIPNDCD